MGKLDRERQETGSIQQIVPLSNPSLWTVLRASWKQSHANKQPYVFSCDVLASSATNHLCLFPLIRWLVFFYSFKFHALRLHLSVPNRIFAIDSASGFVFIG